MQLITPIFFIILSVGIFFGYVDPNYQGIKNDKEVEAQYDEALNRFRELQVIRDDLLSQYNTLNSSDLDRLRKLLPDNIDNVKLIMEIDGIAKQHGINVRNITIRGEKTLSAESLGPDTKEFGSVVLEFSFGASYQNYKNFLGSLESSLRLVEVESVSFLSTVTDFNDYKLSVKSYWLR